MRSKRLAPKILHWFAILWFILAGGIILLGYISILYYQGFGKLQEILNPFNPWNYLAVVITLAPGIAAFMIAKKLRQKDTGDSQ